MSALSPKNVKGKCSNILPNANFINTVSNSQYLDLRQWIRQQINPIAKSPEGKKQQRKQAKEMADNGYLVFMWDKYFATSSHSFCSVTLGALIELWFQCLNIAIWITLPGIFAWEEFLISQEHPQLTGHLTKAGICGFPGWDKWHCLGTKASSWVRWLCCSSSLFCSPWGTGTLWWPQLQVPCQHRAIPHTSKSSHFSWSDTGDCEGSGLFFCAKVGVSTQEM